MVRAGTIAVVLLFGFLVGCSHGGRNNKSGNDSGGGSKQSGNAGMDNNGGNGGSKRHSASANGQLAPYVSLPALDPQVTYRKAMEYCDVQGKVAVFRGMQLVRQQQMANYDCQ